MFCASISASCELVAVSVWHVHTQDTAVEDDPELLETDEAAKAKEVLESGKAALKEHGIDVDAE